MSNKNKRTSCARVKNACKYCLEQVTNKTGIQCQGACKKWAHFKCLNYTPGKISDIKNGIIKVMCPCPDCETTQVKEYLTNPPFSCTKNKCPANKKGPIKCESADCPENRDQIHDECSDKTCTAEKQAAPRMAPIRPPIRSTIRPPIRPPTPPYRSKTERLEAKIREVKRIIPVNSSDSCDIPDCPNRPSNSSSDDDNCPKTQASMVNALQEMCGTVGKLSIQIKDLMGKINKMA